MDPVMVLWIVFGATVVLVAALDLFVIAHRDSDVNVASALRWTGLWIAMALGFGVLVFFFHPNSHRIAVLFFTGYLTEYSLSVDNLFVFILIFSLMNVPRAAQSRLVKLGILLSIVLRIAFILFGVALVERFHWLISLFGLLLIWTAWKMFTADEDEKMEPESNFLYRLAARIFPLHTGDPSTRQLVVRHGGRLCITPLFLALLVIGSTDVVFALDSIPAILGISRDPFVVVTSSVFAVLGLGSLFFAIRGVMPMFKFLQHGVSIILFFIGAKMIAELYEPFEGWIQNHLHVPLVVIAVVLIASMALSVWHTRAFPAEKPESPNP